MHTSRHMAGAGLEGSSKYKWLQWLIQDFCAGGAKALGLGSWLAIHFLHKPFLKGGVLATLSTPPPPPGSAPGLVLHISHVDPALYNATSLARAAPTFVHGIEN